MELTFFICLALTAGGFGIAALGTIFSIAEIQRKVDAIHEKLIGKAHE